MRTVARRTPPVAVTVVVTLLMLGNAGDDARQAKVQGILNIAGTRR